MWFFSLLHFEFSPWLDTTLQKYFNVFINKLENPVLIFLLYCHVMSLLIISYSWSNKQEKIYQNILK